MNAPLREMIAIETTPRAGDHGVSFDLDLPFKCRDGAEILDIGLMRGSVHLHGRIKAPGGKTEPHFWRADSGRSLVHTDFDLINLVPTPLRLKPKPLRVVTCPPIDLRPYLERPACVRAGDTVHVRARVIDINIDGTLVLQFEKSAGDGHLPSTIVAIEGGNVAEGDRVEIAPGAIGEIVTIAGDEAWVRQPVGEGFSQAHGTYKIAGLRRV